MVQRLVVLLALVVISASSSKSHALPPPDVINPYELLFVRPFTGNPALYQSQAAKLKEFIRKYPSLGKYQQTDREVEAAFDNAVKVLSDPVSKYQTDLDWAEAKSKIIDYHEALGVSFGAPAAEISSRIWDLEQALKQPITYNTSVEQARVDAIMKHFEEIKYYMGSPELRAQYDAIVKQKYVEEMQKRISGANPLGEKDLSVAEFGGRWLMSFGAGNIGFMVGNTFELMLKGWYNNDLATQWAAWDTWKDLNGLSSLIMFGAGAEATNKFYEAYIAKGPNAHTDYGMMVGTITSHMWGKFISDKEHEIFVNNWKQSQGLIKQWGETVAQREYNKKEAFAKITLILHRNPNDPKVIAAKKQLAEIADAQDKALADIDKYKSAFWANLGRETWNTVAHWKKEEAEELAISMGRMFVTVQTLKLVDTLVEGLHARWVMSTKFKFLGSQWGIDNQRKALSVMTVEERAQYYELAEKVKNLEVELTKYKGQGDIAGLSEQLAGASAEKIRIIKAKYSNYISKKVNDWVDADLEGATKYVRVPVNKGREIYSAVKNYFYPEVTADMEVTSSLGRRVFVGQTAMSFFYSIPSAVKFLGLDQGLANIGVEAYNTSLLHMRLDRRIKNVNEAVSAFMNNSTVDDQLLSKVSESLDAYDDVWGKYREQVISRESTAALGEWNKMRESHSHDHYLASQWLNWFIHGSSETDPEFVANGGGNPDQVWHVDPKEFSVPFEEQRAQYGKLITLPFDPIEVEKLRRSMQDEEDNFEFDNAISMHKRLKPLVLQAFYGAKAPVWREVVNSVSDDFLMDFRAIGDLFGGIFNKKNWYWGFGGAPVFLDPETDQRIQQAEKEYALQKVELPNNWFDAYVIQFQFLHKQCPGILSQLPSTPLVIAFRKVCSTPTPVMTVGEDHVLNLDTLGYLDLMNSPLVKAEQDYYTTYYTAGMYADHPYDRGDSVALILLSAFQKNIFSFFGLRERYEAIWNNQPESQADVDRANAKASEAEKKKQAELTEKAMNGDEATLHLLGLDKEENPAPAPTAIPAQVTAKPPVINILPQKPH